MFSLSGSKTFPARFGIKRVESYKFRGSRDDMGSFILDFSQFIGLVPSAVVPNDVRVFKKRPYE